MRIVNTRAAALAAVGVALTLSMSACGSDSGTTTSTGSAGSSKATSPSASESPSMTESPSPSMMADKPFGPGCATVPTSGAGSFSGMAKDPVATAATNNPALSTLVTAVKAAGLVDTLNGAKDITVFAPTNDAFAAMDPATLKKALGDPKGLLSKVLTYHVVPGKLTPAMLAGTHKTLQGGEVTVKGSGEDFTVGDNAKVVCGNVATANATVYLIDQVLLPKS